MASNFVDRDRGMKKLIAAAAALEREPFAKVGFLDDGEEKGGTPMAMVAAVHEFGTTMTITAKQAAFMNFELGMGGVIPGDTLTIPERSFIRAAMDEGRNEVGDVSAKLIDAAVTGRMPVAVAVGRLGLLGETMVKRKMVRGPFTPLSPVTIAERAKRSIGSDKPLIDTGEMRNSVRHEVVLDGRAALGAGTVTT